MAKSKIEWTDATWNPVRGCEKVSPGCKHCYAEAFASRFAGTPGHPYEQGFVPRLVPFKISDPLFWSTPSTVFVNSMSDLFQDAVPEDYIKLIAEVMVTCPWHTFQVLTKRHRRMRELLEGPLNFAAEAAHIWWGVSAENRKYGLPRIEELQKMPGRVRFVSAEPLLEDLGPVDFTGIDWVIVGGESGLGARKMEKTWVLNLQARCKADGAKFFFKQWGGVHKKRAGRAIDGRTYNAMPRRRSSPLPSQLERRRLAARFDEEARRWLSSDVAIQLRRAANG